MSVELLFKLEDKTALITGASSGLGKRFAHVLSQAGARVILAARRVDKLDKIANEIESQGGQAISIYMDVADKQSVHNGVNKLLSQGEKIDILINNAGVGEATPIFDDTSDDGAESMITTNVMGVYYVTRMIAGHMKDQDTAGSIINIASVNGASAPATGASAYCASKAAVIQMTKALVGELSKSNIRINAIAPGLFQTEMTQPIIEQQGDMIRKMIPLGFIALPDDLDATVLYLGSNRASRYVTGSCLTIDGGLSWGGK